MIWALQFKLVTQNQVQARRLEKQTENDSSFNKSERHQILALLPS